MVQEVIANRIIKARIPKRLVQQRASDFRSRSPFIARSRDHAPRAFATRLNGSSFSANLRDFDPTSRFSNTRSKAWA